MKLVTREEGMIRLLGLADFLEQDVAKVEFKLRRKKLNMRHWLVPNGTGLQKPSLEPAACATQACAVGWATVAFPRMGLKLYRTGEQTNPFAPSYAGRTWYEAAGLFFGVTEDEAMRLFMPLNNDTRTTVQVIASLREFVAKEWEAQAL